MELWLTEGSRAGTRPLCTNREPKSKHVICQLYQAVAREAADTGD